jgi:single-strand DNA-binding protein
MARSLNKVMLIGNLTRDPEMRYTPQGSAVCSFGIATNSSSTADNGEKKEYVEFHNIVAWNKLAEICAKYLKKGGKVYVEGRLTTQSWQGTDGVKKQRTDIVVSDMMMLDRKTDGFGGEETQASPEELDEKPAKKGNKKEEKSDESKTEEKKSEDVGEEDIPF